MTYNHTIAGILGMEDCVSGRNEDVKQSDSGRWYIRPRVKVIGPEGKPKWSRGKRLYMESTQKRKAQAEANKILEMISSNKVVLQSQVLFGDFLDYYIKEWVRNPEHIAASTAAKYEAHIKNHIRPAFGDWPMAKLTTRAIDEFLKSKLRLSWAPRTDLRNLLSVIFTRARKSGYWQEMNPATDASVGRKKAARPQVKLTTEETQRLLAALKYDVRLICMVALFCTLRISEVLGLQWRDIDWERGGIYVRRRFYRGDVDRVKSEKSERVIPLGYLLDDLKRMEQGGPNDWVFSVKTHENETTPRASRDDRGILQHFLRPAAKELGLYRKGFGFHAMRREAVTAYNAMLPRQQVQNMAGHTKPSMNQRYNLADFEAQEEAIRRFQEKVLGEAEGGVQ